ncbi:hypothetical protein CRUP_008537 [Coryphaenoides rupestris]|nr:hypothetical protein CRUP_008537 [Coryphaenoides rupestris]
MAAELSQSLSTPGIVRFPWQMTEDNVRRVLQEALRVWSEVTPLTFTELRSGKADIVLMEMRATNRRMVSLVAMVHIVAGALEVFSLYCLVLYTAPRPPPPSHHVARLETGVPARLRLLDKAPLGSGFSITEQTGQSLWPH